MLFRTVIKGFHANIFAVCSELGLSLYDESLCNRRWSCLYYKESKELLS